MDIFLVCSTKSGTALLGSELSADIIQGSSTGDVTNFLTKHRESPRIFMEIGVSVSHIPLTPVGQ